MLVAWQGSRSGESRQSVLVHVLLHANLLGLEEEEIGVYEYVYEYVRSKRDEKEHACRTAYRASDWRDSFPSVM